MITRKDGLLSGLLLLVVFLCYSSALRNGLVSDDFVLFIGHTGRGLRGALSYQGAYHTIPVGYLFLWLQGNVCALDGMGHHLFSLSLFWALSLTTVWLGSRIGLSKAVAWGAALLVATSAQVFEVPLWALATLHSGSGILALLAFGAYLRLVERPGWRRQSVFVALSILAFLWHEQALSVPLVCLLWSVMISGERHVGVLVKRLLPVLAAVGMFAVVKVVWNDGSSVLPGVDQGLVRTLSLIAYHGLRTLVPSLSTSAAWAIFRPESAIGFALPFLVAAGLLFVGFRTTVTERFLVLWTLGHVGMMVVAIGMSSRHYALPLVPASLALASLLERASGALMPRRPLTVFAASVAVVSLVGLVQLPEKLSAWRRASLAVERILGDVERAAAAHPEATRLTVLNLPDGVPLHRAEPAYIFRHGFEDAVPLRLPGRFARVERRRTEPFAPWVEPLGRVIDPSELDALVRNPEDLVLVASGPESGLSVVR